MIDVKRLRELLAAGKQPTVSLATLERWQVSVTAEACNALPALLDVYEAACRWADDPDSTDQALLDEIEKARES